MRRIAGFFLCLVSTLPLVPVLAQSAAPHPFTSHDWAVSRSASPVGVSPNGATILYRVSFGAESGPSTSEFWFIHSDGSSPIKLELPSGFTPAGFLASAPAGANSALYGTYRVNNYAQLAVFALNGNKAAAAPTTLVALPRGVDTILPSPDGTRFAILADPRAPDPLAATRTVVEAGQTSLYLVHTDGPVGQWACPTLHDLAGGEESSTAPFAWSPDSTQLVVLSSTPKIGSHDLRSNIDLCSPTSGAHHLAEIPNAVSSIAFSSQNEIAFLSTTAPTQTPDHLFTVATTGGTITDRTPDLANTAAALVAAPGGTVFVEIAHGVRNEVHTFANHALISAYTWPDGAVGLPVFSPYATSSQPTCAWCRGSDAYAERSGCSGEFAATHYD
jgi:hypothetical protein